MFDAPMYDENEHLSADAFSADPSPKNPFAPIGFTQQFTALPKTDRHASVPPPLRPGQLYYGYSPQPTPALTPAHGMHAPAAIPPMPNQNIYSGFTPNESGFHTAPDESTASALSNTSKLPAYLQKRPALSKPS
ncbi:MAG: hypothetical protein RR142_11980, partial [Clostridia bacterium]